MREALSRQRALVLALVILAALAARAFYCFALGVRFDATTLQTYLQYVDPELLKTRLLESVLYLRDQPPLFNLFLGVVLKLAPDAYATVFHGLYLALGVAIAAALYVLLARLGAPLAVAAVVAVGYAVHPATVLYENWLIYEYPLTAALLGAALLLHRYVAAGRTRDALGCFALLAAVVLMRGTFHLLWLLLIVGGVVLLRPRRWRSVLLAAAVPVALALALYVKNYVVFGEWLSGEVYRKLNYAVMTTARLPVEVKLRMLAEGRLSPAHRLNFYRQPVTDYQPFLPPIRNTGIAVLDRPLKSSGAPNWQHHAMPQLADLYYRDAVRVGREHPELYREAVADNLRRLFLPANETFPFDQPDHENVRRLRAELQLANLLLTGQWRSGQAGVFTVVLVPLVIVGALGGVAIGLWRRLRRRSDESDEQTARLGVAAFCLWNFVYVSASTVLLSYADHNRYRFCVTPLFLVLLWLCVAAVGAWWRRTLPAPRASAGPRGSAAPGTRSGPATSDERRRHRRRASGTPPP